MKNKWIKVLSILSTVCLILGGAALIVGVVLGADIRDAWKQSGNWNSITKYGVFSFFADEDDQDDHDTEELFDEDFSFQSQDIKRINFDLKNVDLTIEENNSDDQVRIQIENSGKNDISVKNNNGTLEIKDHRSKIGKTTKNIDVALDIPADLELEDVLVELGVGDVEIEKLLVKYTLNMKLGTGDVEIEHLSAGTLDVSCGVGNLEIEKLRLEGSASIEGGVGDTRIGMLANENDFNYEISTGVGDVRIFDSEFRGLGGAKKISNGSDKEIVIHSGVGDMEIYQAN